jgi:hypothetical protein
VRSISDAVNAISSFTNTGSIEDLNKESMGRHGKCRVFLRVRSGRCVR